MPLNLEDFRTDKTFKPGRKVEALSTGSFLFDYITGIGGLPRGRMVEAFGLESSGKSTVMYQAMAQAQKAGGVAVLMDYEHSWTEEYAEMLGIDLNLETLLVEQPESLGEGFQKALDITAAMAALPAPRPPLIIVFDSLAAVPMEDERVDNNMAAAHRAKEFKAYLRKAAGVIDAADAIWAFINHEMDNIFTGPTWQIQADKARLGSTTTPGGKAIKFYCSQRYQFQAGKKLKGDVVDPVTGEVTEGFIAVKTKVVAVKNKVAHPHRRADVLIRYGAGIDNSFSLLEVGIARGLIQRPTTQKYIMPDGTEVRSAAAALEYLQENPVAAAKLEATLRSLIQQVWEDERERQLTAATEAATLVASESDEEDD